MQDAHELCILNERNPYIQKQSNVQLDMDCTVCPDKNVPFQNEYIMTKLQTCRVVECLENVLCNICTMHFFIQFCHNCIKSQITVFCIILITVTAHNDSSTFYYMTNTQQTQSFYVRIGSLKYLFY